MIRRVWISSVDNSSNAVFVGAKIVKLLSDRISSMRAARIKAVRVSNSGVLSRISTIGPYTETNRKR